MTIIAELVIYLCIGKLHEEFPVSTTRTRCRALHHRGNCETSWILQPRKSFSNLRVTGSPHVVSATARVVGRRIIWEKLSPVVAVFEAKKIKSGFGNLWLPLAVVCRLAIFSKMHLDTEIPQAPESAATKMRKFSDGRKTRHAETGFRTTLARALKTMFFSHLGPAIFSSEYHTSDTMIYEESHVTQS